VISDGDSYRIKDAKHLSPGGRGRPVVALLASGHSSTRRICGCS